MIQKFEILLLLLLQVAQEINQLPISVPVDYPDVSGRYPNAHYNRLPGNRYSDSVNANDNSVTDEYEDYDEQTSNKPSAQYTSSSNYNINSNNYSPILTENFIKHKKKRRRKIRRPCIPIQSFNSPLFTNNRYKREVDSRESGKTFGHLFGGYRPYVYPPPVGTPFYGNYYGSGGYPAKPYFDNVRPQSDSSATSNAPLYNPVGGYPCVPVSYGHVPHGGPFGFFGPGGLFDTGASPSFVVPQTVIVNRPPLFGNKPQYGSKPPLYGSRPPFLDPGPVTDADERPGGFWSNVVDKLSEFVTSVNPQAVYTAIGDTLQGLGTAIQNAQPAVAAVDTIRNGYREFASLIYR